MPLPGFHDLRAMPAPQIRFASCHRIMPWSETGGGPQRYRLQPTVAPDRTELSVPDCNGKSKGGDLRQRGCAPGPFSVGPSRVKRLHIREGLR